MRCTPDHVMPSDPPFPKQGSWELSASFLSNCSDRRKKSIKVFLNDPRWENKVADNNLCEGGCCNTRATEIVEACSVFLVEKPSPLYSAAFPGNLIFQWVLPYFDQFLKQQTRTKTTKKFQPKIPFCVEELSNIHSQN